MDNHELNGEKPVDVVGELQRLQAESDEVPVDEAVLGDVAIGGACDIDRDRRPSKGQNTTISPSVDRIGEADAFTKRLSISSFSKLGDQTRLLIAVGMAGSSYYEEIFEDKESEERFLLAMVNKGKSVDPTKKPGRLLDEDGMKEILAEAVEEGWMEFDEQQRPRLTEDGLKRIHARTKKAGYNDF